jgi:hypothetical protein
MSLRKPGRDCPALLMLSRAAAKRPHPPKEPGETQANGRVRWFQPLVALVVAGLIALAFVLGSALSNTESDVDANRDLINRVGEVSKRADREIVQARLAAIPSTCEKFNDIQHALSNLIRVALASPRRQDIPIDRYREFRAAFKAELETLRPNDCGTQIELLRERLREQGYDAAVPYRSSYPGH